MPAWAYDGIDDLERIEDYQARMVKRERIDGRLGEYESLFIKVRHRPFSVYTYFLGPENKRGQEAIYRADAYDGKVMGHGVGINKMFGTVPLDPTGQIAMKDNRYPITEIGLLTLVRRLIEVGEQDINYGECEVKFYPGPRSRIESAPACRLSIPRRAAISGSTSPGFSSTMD